MLLALVVGVVVLTHSALGNTDLGPCTCDVTANVCDTDPVTSTACCCDPSCPDSSSAYFNASGLVCAPSPVLSSRESRLCVNRDKVRASNGLDATWFGDLLCVTTDNYPSDGFYYPPPPSPLSPAATSATLSAATSPSFAAAPSTSSATAATTYLIGSSILASSTSTPSPPSPLSVPSPMGVAGSCSLSSSSAGFSYLPSTPVQTRSCEVTLTPGDNNGCAGVGDAAALYGSLGVLPSPSASTDPSSHVPITRTPVCYSGTDRASRTVVTCPGSGGLADLASGYDAATGRCLNVVTDVEVSVVYRTDNVITGAAVTLGVALVGGSGGNTSFTTSVVSKLSLAPIDLVPVVRSGNPGYLAGKPVLGGIFAADGLSLTRADLTVSGGDGRGTCLTPGAGGGAGSGSHPWIGYGADALVSCWIEVTDAALTDCAALQSSILASLLPGQSVNAVAAWGNSDPATVGDWTSIVMPASTPVPAQGAGSCANIVVGLEYGFVSVPGGAANNPQDKLIGAQMEYVVGSVGAGGRVVLTTSVSFVRNTGVSAQEAFPRNPNLIPELPSDVWYPFRVGSAGGRSAPMAWWGMCAIAVALFVGVSAW